MYLVRSRPTWRRLSWEDLYSQTSKVKVGLSTRVVPAIKAYIQNVEELGGNVIRDKRSQLSCNSQLRDYLLFSNWTVSVLSFFIALFLQLVVDIKILSLFYFSNHNDCGGDVIEYDMTAGNGFCVRCGTVVEENTIVNEVSFGETSAGAAMVQGAFVGHGSTHPRMSGPYGNRGSVESREQTIANATKKIQDIAGILRLSEQVCLSATRLFTLAFEHKFTKGRKSLNVVAVCMYVACRQKETRNYMLIDFSDLLQVNVFELGHTYLQLVQTLNLRLPLIDPSHYISRFAALLEFGDETNRVATDAIRLVQRFDRDWMTRGRRPAGICGAALLLAARMNNFRRSIEEIVQVVKIADSTLKKRLDEFKNTPSGALTLADFRTVWLEDEVDPPAYTKGKEKEEADRLAAEQDALGIEPPSTNKGKGKKGKGKEKKKKKRKRGDEDEDTADEDMTANGDANDEPIAIPQRPSIDPMLMNEGILAGTQDPPLFLPDPSHIDVPDCNIDPTLLQESSTSSSPDPALVAPPVDPFEEAVSSALAEEVSTFLDNTQGSMLTTALDDAEQERLAQIQTNIDDELMGLDEDELNRFLLTDEEVKIKERVWVELNKDYLEALAAKGDLSSSKEAKGAKSRKRQKVSNKPRDTTTPHGATTAESVRSLIQKNPKYSKRINYDALKDLFVDSNDNINHPLDTNFDSQAAFDGAIGPLNFDVGDADLYTMDDKDDKDDTDLVVIEEDGIVGVSPLPSREAMDQDHDETERETGIWEDVYEQEV
ncbi:hypothetical protein BDP27DRAFT_1383193 [Rhodocollybia butyracea]|uniref:B-related factor 1 n=1 Tax=Rhodocollybia butyracea TaxID=206335 RepID=A0A9P5PUN6_9AGAR|nr:hypothetical protein BDP27DRAFT_1383193 [Rhodocollybia butyracea]